MAVKPIMFALDGGGCFPGYNIGTSKVRWNKVPDGRAPGGSEME